MTQSARRPARPFAVVGLALVLAVTAWVGVGTAAPSGARAAGPILTVDRTDDVASASLCTDGPDDCSLRGATINANADGFAEIETIEVPAGTYVLSATADGQFGGSLDLQYSARVIGAGSATTIIDANGFDRGFVLARGAGPITERVIELIGMTVRNGNSCVRGSDGTGGHFSGGGIFSSAIATLSDMVIEDNSAPCAQAAGGIWSGGVGASLSISGSVIRNNVGPGGAGGLMSFGTTTIIDSTIDGNSSDTPGGGMILGGTATISGSTISNNVGVKLGGGIFAGDDTTSGCCAATIRIVNSTLSGNISRFYNSGTPQYFPGVGGAIGIKRTALVLEDSTITANVSQTNPTSGQEGVAGGISMGYEGTLEIRRSIVAGNTGETQCALGLTVVTGSDSITADCGVGSGADPTLGTLADNGGPTLTHALLAGSPAIDAAGGSCPATDQRGITRPQGAACDIGSFELGAASPLDLDIGDCDDQALATLVQVDGNMMLSDPSCPTLSLPELVSVGGDMVLTGNPTLTVFDAPVLDWVGGDMDISNDATLTVLDAPSLDSVGGDMTFTSDPTLTVINAPELDSVGGDMDISNDATLTVITAPELDSVGGDMILTGDPTLTVIDAPELDSVGGVMDISNDATLTVINVPELDSVGGDMDVSTTGASLDLGGVAVTGTTTITGDGTTFVDTQTAAGETRVSLVNGSATLSIVLPTGAYATPVLFRADSLGATSPEDSLTPVAAYRLTGRCAWPLCGGSTTPPSLLTGAPISLGVDLDGLDAATRTTLTAALADGRASVAVKADTVGSTYDVMPICTTGQTPVGNGCIAIVTTGSLVRFDAVATHFSTWAVVMAAAPPAFTPTRKLGEWKTDRTGTAALLPQTLGEYAVTTMTQAKAIFDRANCSKAKSDDATACLAGHLLAAELNLAAGSDPCGAADVSRANRFLRGEAVDGVVGIRYTGPDTYVLSKAQRSLALTLKDALEAYDNGLGCNA